MEQLGNLDNKFDLVLLDLIMPIMDGFEVLTLMQQDERMQEIPVVVMSGNDSQQIVSDCLRLGAKDYFPKPVRKSQIQSLSTYI